ncbi:S-Ena type endospore appendage [Alkalibacillus haloalkaliphilus]|uniref:Endospore appendages core domain-containing protein n=1 Tax=Alkalibacillus haloalkaliphilus TaxID=94136 RepID=A0A511W4V3_9BACI|nr:S-Ena type endospore appendage [Alkalibacillus haloalkaliphilus]GEN46134.1 hypothetical protein AHA02nite_19100 [Alkalibacillus haloalkaliphilus]
MAEYCINVEKVYDWITFDWHKQLCAIVPCPSHIVTDDVCGNFLLSNVNEKVKLWESTLDDPISGTISLNLEYGDLSYLSVFINGKEVETEGMQLSQTSRNIRMLEVRLNRPSLPIRGKYCLILHYNFFHFPNMNKEVIEVEDKAVKLTCKEIASRKCKEIRLPDGRLIILQEVFLLIEGAIKLIYEGKACVVPFKFTRTLLLCAPAGTKVVCDLISFHSQVTHVRRSKDCYRIDLEVDLCIEVKVVYKTTVKVPANQCLPRIAGVDIEEQ